MGRTLDSRLNISHIKTGLEMLQVDKKDDNIRNQAAVIVNTEVMHR